MGKRGHEINTIEERLINIGSRSSSFQKQNSAVAQWAQSARKLLRLIHFRLSTELTFMGQRSQNSGRRLLNCGYIYNERVLKCARSLFVLFEEEEEEEVVGKKKVNI